MIIAFSILALAFAIMFWAFRPGREGQVFVERPPADLATMAIQIVCLDCGGDDYKGRRTHLTAAGCCDTCGGRSFLLAGAVARPVALPEPILERGWYEAPRPGKWTN